MKLTELVNETETAEVKIAGEAVTLTFYRHSSAQMRAEALQSGRITRGEFDALAKADGDDALSFPFSVALAVRLKCWTLEVEHADGRKESPPVTSAFLAGFRDEHFLPLWRTVFEGRPSVPFDESDSTSG
jgi:hypothetical protein